jgi:ATP-dependent DNA ligase
VEQRSVAMISDKSHEKSANESLANFMDQESAAGLLLVVAAALALISAEPPSGPGWLHEIKRDGFRTLTRIPGNDFRAFTRSGRSRQIIL